MLPDLSEHHRVVKRRRLQECVAVFSMAYSKDNTMLAAGANTGDICIWNVERCLRQTATLEERERPVKTIARAHSNTVYAMATHEDLLYTTGGPEINAWKWSHFNNDEGASEKVTPVSSVCIKPPPVFRGSAEINALAMDSMDNTLLAAGGDGNLHLIDVSTATSTGLLCGHTDTVHSVACIPGSVGRYASASEDGTVKLWDRRTAKATTTFDPAQELREHPKYQKIERRGRWVSTVAIDLTGMWLACGGGVPGTVWHLGSNTCTTALVASGRSDQISEMKFLTDGRVQTIGNDSAVRQWSRAGELLTSKPALANDGILHVSEGTVDAGPLTMTTFGGTGTKISIFAHGLTRLSFNLSFATTT